MKPGLFRDALLVVAPCAAVVAGLASVDHHQRLVEAGYRVARLEKERDDLSLEVEHRRVRVANLSSPVRLLGEARDRKLTVDYPIAWNRVSGDGEAAALLAKRSAPKASQKPNAGAVRDPRAGRTAPPGASPAPVTGRKGSGSARKGGKP
jgi:hypothetical protein